MIAKIAVSAATFAIDKPYSYRIPDGLHLLPGIRVQVPFGRGNRRTEGVVLAIEPGSDPDLKTIDCSLDEEPVLTQQMLRLAAFMRERYFCTFFDAIRVMLPSGLWFKEKNIVRLTDDRSWKEKTVKQSDALRILLLLEDLGGEAKDDILTNAVPDAQALEAALAYLTRKKWVEAQTDFLHRIGDKTEQIATLAASVEEAMEYAFHRPKSAAMQRAVLELLCSLGTVSLKELCYFTGAKPATVRRLADLGYVNLQQQSVLRCRQIRPVQVDGPLVLNSQQQAAFDGIVSQMGDPNPGCGLLYGVTGSGKTSVYLKLIQHTLDQGKAALLLVPEIALTPQLLGLLAGYFGEQVAVLHSSLAATERYDQWKRIRSGDAKVIVGTRSAVFAPSENLGLIILDEEQEHSYKSENTPRYCAKEVALWRGAKEGAMVLLGSATPSIETMYHARQGHYRLYQLKNRYNGKELPQVSLVDMRQELKEGNGTGFSLDLREAILKTWKSDRQTVLFLNRRGNSRALVCVDCRQAPECPRCNARLTYHSANERLMCHYCGYSQPSARRCSCGGALKPIGTGTQKAQQELLELFPDIQIARMDADTVTATNTHEQILQDFQQQRIPVLLGTQMVAKGLNLPDVTLVGVLDGDLSLYSSSYRAAETTFNMLTQVVGRAGRGDTGGQAIVQTLVPEHPVLNLAARQDYDGFYELEIGLRQALGNPPFGDLAAITFTGQEEVQVLRSAVKFRDSLQSCLKLPEYKEEYCTLLGPAPCVVPKINYNFRYALTLRCRMTKRLRQLLAHLLRQFAADGGNRGVSAFADVNGYDG
ncbi:MAG: primosomal protein N' [Oscillospiraceae bacterium]|nr:primosomal protein N' [Oscillospiraceae bacterium]